MNKKCGYLKQITACAEVSQMSASLILKFVSSLDDISSGVRQIVIAHVACTHELPVTTENLPVKVEIELATIPWSRISDSDVASSCCAPLFYSISSSA